MMQLQSELVSIVVTAVGDSSAVSNEVVDDLRVCFLNGIKIMFKAEIEGLKKLLFV